MFPGLSALGSEPWAMSREPWALMDLCCQSVSTQYFLSDYPFGARWVRCSWFIWGGGCTTYAMLSHRCLLAIPWNGVTFTWLYVYVCMSVHSILCVHIYNALPEIHDVRLAGVSMSSMNGFQGNHNTILSFSRPSMWFQGGWHPCMEFSQFIYTLYFYYKFAYPQKFFSSSAFS